MERERERERERSLMPKTIKSIQSKSYITHLWLRKSKRNKFIFRSKKEISFSINFSLPESVSINQGYINETYCKRANFSFSFLCVIEFATKVKNEKKCVCLYVCL